MNINEGTAPRDEICISVRSLVEFLLVSGSIDISKGSVNPVTAMQEGSRIHKKLQKKAGPLYHAEVPLSYSYDFGDFDLLVSGRADGIIFDDEKLKDKDCPVTVDEIKGVYLDLEKLEEPIDVHLSQAKCYAFIFSEENDLEEISVRLTYVNIDTEEIKYFENGFSFVDLKDWFFDLVEKYRRWADFTHSWKMIRTESLKKMSFPFEYRKGQRKLVSEIYYSIKEKKTLFLQAPTGTGKTLATLFPAMKSQGEGLCDIIFYLTAKNATRAVCEDTLSLLRQGGLKEKSVTISAREKACLNDEFTCMPETCRFADGHFDRILDAVFDILTHEDSFSTESIKKCALAHNVCPYYLSLELSDWSDIVLCDYNYVFDPVVALKRFFGEGKKGDYIFLIDEAHNLVERGREMYSESIGRAEVLSVKRYFKKEIFGVKKALTRVNKIMKEWEDQEGAVIFPERDEQSSRDSFLFSLMTLSGALERFLDEGIETEGLDEIRQFYFRVRFFLSIADYAGEGYVFYCVRDESGKLSANLFCVDPSGQLSERLSTGRASVFFSATLLPMQYYKDLLCREEKPFAVFAESSFDEKKLGVFLGNDVTSLYRQRSDDMYLRYASYLSDIIAIHEGNYIAFFPSYSFMEKVNEKISERFLPDSTRVLMQKKDMNEEERKEFLENFRKKDEHTLGLCVMGGAFSEGIDLTGESLIGAIIVGAALPQVGTRQDIIKDYFEEHSMDGFSYAYLYPGMAKVLQAAGRVIRTEEDTGIVVLLDHRFMKSEYKDTFPSAWKKLKAGDHDTLCVDIRAFWDSCF